MLSRWSVKWNVCLRRHRWVLKLIAVVSATVELCYILYMNMFTHRMLIPSCLNNSVTVNLSKQSMSTVLAQCEGPSNDHYCLCYSSNTTSDERCALTFRLKGRLGNNMGEYAALYGLSSLNRRPAFISRDMAAVLRRYFKITLPVLSETLESCIDWTQMPIHDYMEDGYAHLQGRFIRLMGAPYSWKFYSHVADEIRNEFTFKIEISQNAQRQLSLLRENRTSTTFVGVHVRRGDYVQSLQGPLRGVVAKWRFFQEAMDRFRRRYTDAIFVVVSDDMPWCIEHLSNGSGDVYFVGNSNQSAPISDLAILANCNHTIFSIGSFGYWGAFLAGGQVIYLTNYTLPDSPLNSHLRFETLFWPRWQSIAANLSDFGHSLN